MNEHTCDHTAGTEPLQLRCLELDRFVAESLRKLNELSESLAQVRIAVPAVQPGTTINESPAQLPDDFPEGPAAPAVAGTTNQVTDPLEQLNAIKLRLAQQIATA